MIKKRLKSFKYASDGLFHALTHHHNFLIHIILSIIMVTLGFWTGLSRIEWIILVLTISFGLVIELINTAIESVVNLITQEYRLHAKYAKDLSAAAMLVYSVGAVIVALILILSKF